MSFILERINKYRYYLFLLLPLLVMMPGMAGFPYPGADALYSDLAISHFPNAIYLRDQLLAGQFPLWSDTILSGYPFAANPLSSIWYLPHYFALLFPLPFGLNLMVILHLFFGGIGLFQYLRKQGLSERAALLGALAFISMPKLYAHLGVGHLTLLYAISWTPWLLLALESKRDRWFKQPGFVMGIIFLADPRWAAYAGLLWLGWFLAGGLDKLPERALNFGVQLLLALLLAAPLLFPLLDYTGLSTRIHMTPEDVYTFSMSPANLIGLFYPNFGAGQKDLVYFGLIPLVLVIVVLMTRIRRKAAFWLWVAGISLIYALGDNIPGMVFLARVPGLSLLRVPPRALFLTGLSFAILSAFALDTLSATLEPRVKKRLRLALVAVTTFSVVIAVMVALMMGNLRLEFIWGAVLILLAWALIEVWFAQRVAFKTFFLILTLLALLDWGAINQSLFAYQPREVVLAQGAEAAAWLADQPGDFRIYSPSYSIPQHTAVLYGLQLADGVDPMQLEAYADYMEAATGVPREGYGVTIPAFTETGEGGDISQTNRAYLPDIEMLAAINVRYIASEFDLALGLPIAVQFDQTRIYELPVSPAQEHVEFDYGQYTQMMYFGLAGFALGVLGLNWAARRQRPA